MREFFPAPQNTIVDAGKKQLEWAVQDQTSSIKRYVNFILDFAVAKSKELSLDIFAVKKSAVVSSVDYSQ